MEYMQGKGNILIHQLSSAPEAFTEMWNQETYREEREGTTYSFGG